VGWLWEAKLANIIRNTSIRCVHITDQFEKQISHTGSSKITPVAVAAHYFYWCCHLFMYMSIHICIFTTSIGVASAAFFIQWRIWWPWNAMAFITGQTPFLVAPRKGGGSAHVICVLTHGMFLPKILLWGSLILKDLLAASVQTARGPTFVLVSTCILYVYSYFVYEFLLAMLIRRRPEIHFIGLRLVYNEGQCWNLFVWPWQFVQNVFV